MRQIVVVDDARWLEAKVVCGTSERSTKYCEGAAMRELPGDGMVFKKDKAGSRKGLLNGPRRSQS